MGDLIRMRYHGSSATAARLGPRNTRAEQYNPSLVVPVIPNGLGGVIRPDRPGEVWVYMPMVTFPTFSADTTRLLDVDCSGWVGDDAELLGGQLISHAEEIMSFINPSARIQGERFDFSIPNTSIGWKSTIGLSLVLALRVNFERDLSSDQSFFTLWWVEVDYEETS